MAFVQAKFPLPTVSRPDGTLGAYVQYNSNPRGDRFIFPAERIAIYQQQQAAKLLAAKKSRQFSLLKLLAPGPAAPAKRGVQTTANLKGLRDIHVDDQGCQVDDDGVRLTCPDPTGKQVPSK